MERSLRLGCVREGWMILARGGAWGHGRVNEVRVWEGSLRMNKGCEQRQRPSCIQVQVYSVWLEQMIGWGFRD